MSLFSSDAFKLVATAILVVLALIVCVSLAIMLVPKSFWGAVPFRTLAVTFLLLYPVVFVAQRYWGVRRKRGYWPVLLGLASANAVFVVVVLAYHVSLGTFGVASVFGLEAGAAVWAFYRIFDVPPPASRRKST
jgi:hypothetical protein